MKKLMILCMSNFTSAHLFTTNAKPQFLSHIAYCYVNLRHRLGIVKHIVPTSQSITSWCDMKKHERAILMECSRTLRT